MNTHGTLVNRNQQFVTDPGGPSRLCTCTRRGGVLRLELIVEKTGPESGVTGAFVREEGALADANPARALEFGPG